MFWPDLMRAADCIVIGNMRHDGESEFSLLGRLREPIRAMRLLDDSETCSGGLFMGMSGGSQ